jgi:hypothetical protein
VLRRAGRVLDRQVAGQEVVAHHSCRHGPIHQFL